MGCDGVRHAQRHSSKDDSTLPDRTSAAARATLSRHRRYASDGAATALAALTHRPSRGQLSAESATACEYGSPTASAPGKLGTGTAAGSSSKERDSRSQRSRSQGSSLSQQGTRLDEHARRRRTKSDHDVASLATPTSRSPPKPAVVGSARRRSHNRANNHASSCGGGSSGRGSMATATTVAHGQGAGQGSDGSSTPTRPQQRWLLSPLPLESSPSPQRTGGLRGHGHGHGQQAPFGRTSTPTASSPARPRSGSLRMRQAAEQGTRGPPRSCPHPSPRHSLKGPKGSPGSSPGRLARSPNRSFGPSTSGSSAAGRPRTSTPPSPLAQPPPTQPRHPLPQYTGQLPPHPHAQPQPQPRSGPDSPKTPDDSPSLVVGVGLRL